MATFAHDTNLRFPLDDPAWVALFEKHGVEPVGYDDMRKLGDDLTAEVLEIAFLPAGNYFYLRERPYRPVANALGAPDGSAELASVMVVPKESAATELAELRGARLAYTHEFCTTSYFATALLLHENGLSIDGFFDLVAGYAFEAQLDALLDGTVEATMVQEGVLKSRPDALEATRALGRRAALPGPLMIVGESAGEELASEFTELLFSHGLPPRPDNLFTGFAPYKRELVERFCEDSAAALPG
ncbi:MAG TPA: PhnD/SsuA/transferrin family substrate-binding protein [Solirubrobacterales bacterium]